MELYAFLESHLVCSAVILGWFGLLVGSFLNVVIYRLPIFLEQQARNQCAVWLDQRLDSSDEDLSLWKPRSFCPNCKKILPLWNNIPLVSYLFLKGKSHCCRQKIPLRYPIVEILSCLAAITLTLYFSLSMNLIAALIFVWFLIPLIFIDLEKEYLPDQLTLTLLWMGLLFNIFNTFTKLSDAVLGVIFGYLFLYLIAWVFKKIRKKEGMGHGDFKLGAAFGAWFGWQTLPLVIFIASAVGAIISLHFVLFKKTKSDTPIPFGPYLAVASVITLICGRYIYHLTG